MPAADVRLQAANELAEPMGSLTDEAEHSRVIAETEQIGNLKVQLDVYHGTPDESFDPLRGRVVMSGGPATIRAAGPPEASLLVEFAVFRRFDERCPFSEGELESRPRPVLAVADGDARVEESDLNTVVAPVSVAADSLLPDGMTEFSLHD